MNTKGYAFEQIVDVKQLQELMDLFHATSGIPSAIITPDGKILIATGWQDLCTRFHRVHPVTAARCLESDNYIKDHLLDNKYVAYKCKNGLSDVAVPIMIEGRHVSTLFLGQFLFEDEKPDIGFFRQQAEEFGFDVDEYLAAFSRIPVFSRETVQSIIDYKLSFVELISTLGRNHLELAIDIEERKRVEEAMRVKSHELGERVKELNCLYSISRLVEQEGSLLGEIIQGVLDLIPPAFQHPEITCAQVMLQEERHQTRNFKETEIKIARDILVHDEQIGCLEICLQDQDLGCDKDHFLAEEKNLIDMIGERLGRVIERKQAQEALRESKEQLYQAQKMETLGTLVAGVAHEINNPTNMIMMNVRLLQKIWHDFQPILEEQAKTEPERKYAGLTYDFLEENIGQLLSDMEMGVNRIARTVTDLKDFAQRSETTEEEPISINTAVENALRLAQTTLRKSGVDLKVDLQDDLPLIKGTLQNIEQILLNLVINAVQAIDHDHGMIGLVTGMDKQTDRVFLTVSDNGTGIASNLSDKIFEPFVTNKQTKGGLGLGLSISKNLVKAHRGDIAFHTQDGKGTTFTVTFPGSGN